MSRIRNTGKKNEFWLVTQVFKSSPSCPSVSSAILCCGLGFGTFCPVAHLSYFSRISNLIHKTTTQNQRFLNLPLCTLCQTVSKRSFPRPQSWRKTCGTASTWPRLPASASPTSSPRPRSSTRTNDVGANRQEHMFSTRVLRSRSDWLRVRIQYFLILPGHDSASY